MKKISKKKFANVIYVMIHKEGSDEFSIVHHDYAEVAFPGERVIVGVYELKAVKTVVASPELI